MMLTWSHKKLGDLQATGRELPVIFIGALFAVACLLSGCEQKMGSQPSYQPLESSRFFADGRASRPLVSGTVPHGTLEDNSTMFTGRKSAAVPRTAMMANANSEDRQLAASSQPQLNPDEFATQLPFPLSVEVLERGQQRYTIYCAVCHGPTGAGDGTVVRRGFTRPPSYISDNSRQFARSGFQVPLRDVPLGYFFEVATHGYGAMADYAEQVEPRDRWAIAAFIRTLQFSQQAPFDALPTDIRDEALRTLGAIP
ncbi:MAG TPA: cytochrome c [Pirellulales bacterium]|jgi:mono/diheme cytochrome c family protein